MVVLRFFDLVNRSGCSLVSTYTAPRLPPLSLLLSTQSHSKLLTRKLLARCLLQQFTMRQVY